MVSYTLVGPVEVTVALHAVVADLSRGLAAIRQKKEHERDEARRGRANRLQQRKSE